MDVYSAYGVLYMVVFCATDEEYLEFCNTGIRADTCPQCSSTITEKEDRCPECQLYVVWTGSRLWKQLYGKPMSVISANQCRPMGPAERAAAQKFGIENWPTEVIHNLKLLRRNTPLSAAAGVAAAEWAIKRIGNRSTAAKRACIDAMVKQAHGISQTGNDIEVIEVKHDEF